MAAKRREQIIHAAQRLYAREGFHRATIKKIAHEARLKSPALIYWYFRDKGELFQAVVRQLSPLLQRLPDIERRMDSPPPEVLSLIATTYLRTFDDPRVRQLFRIFLAEASQKGEFVSEFSSSIMPVLNFIVGYLEHQVKLGRLRPHDSQCAARSFMGSLVVYVLGREIIPALRTNLPDTEQYVREVVSIFLSGLMAKDRSQTSAIVSEGGAHEAT